MGGVAPLPDPSPQTVKAPVVHLQLLFFVSTAMFSLCTRRQSEPLKGAVIVSSIGEPAGLARALDANHVKANNDAALSLALRQAHEQDCHKVILTNAAFPSTLASGELKCPWSPTCAMGQGQGQGKLVLGAQHSTHPRLACIVPYKS